MVNYSDIKNTLKDFEINERKHLFKIGNYQVEFWIRRDGLWRIVTDASKDTTTVISMWLNDTLSEDAKRVNGGFRVEDAWRDIDRPIFAIPKLTSQIIGNIPDIDTINRIWAAFSNIVGNTNSDFKMVKKVNWNKDMPKGHSIEGILRRLSKTPDTNDAPIEHEIKRKIIRTVEKEITDEEIDNYIWELTKQGKTHKEMVQLIKSEFKKNVSEYRIRKVKKTHREVSVVVEHATPEDIDQLILSLRDLGKTYKEMKEEIYGKYRESVSDYKIKNVLRANNRLNS